MSSVIRFFSRLLAPALRIVSPKGVNIFSWIQEDWHGIRGHDKQRGPQEGEGYARGKAGGIARQGDGSTGAVVGRLWPQNGDILRDSWGHPRGRSRHARHVLVHGPA